jgi:hypothetical protein
VPAQRIAGDRHRIELDHHVGCPGLGSDGAQRLDGEARHVHTDTLGRREERLGRVDGHAPAGLALCLGKLQGARHVVLESGADPRVDLFRASPQLQRFAVGSRLGVSASVRAARLGGVGGRIGGRGVGLHDTAQEKACQHACENREPHSPSREVVSDGLKRERMPAHRRLCLASAKRVDKFGAS